MQPVTEDAVVTRSRREALIAFGLWLASLIYTVGYCYLYGYDRTGQDPKFVLWFPDWVFWGIVVPWLACVVASTIFAFGIMGAEPLGPEAPMADDDTTHSEMNLG